jgi:hypothetical protein
MPDMASQCPGRVPVTRMLPVDRDAGAQDRRDFIEEKVCRQMPDIVRVGHDVECA